MTVQQNFIAGEWMSAANAAPDINPSDLKDVVGDYARASRHDAETAIAAAKAASHAAAAELCAATARRRFLDLVERVTAPRVP